MGAREFYIRQATSSNVETLAGLSARTFKSAYETKLPSDDLDSFVASTFSPERIREEMNDPTCKFLLAYEDGKAIGYAMLREINPPAGVTGPRPVELARIYLEDRVIGRGYGAALMKACLETAKEGGYETVWLGVWEENDRAIHFYEQWGFSMVGSHAFEFGGEIQTDLVMARSMQNVVRREI